MIVAMYCAVGASVGMSTRKVAPTRLPCKVNSTNELAGVKPSVWAMVANRSAWFETLIFFMVWCSLCISFRH